MSDTGYLSGRPMKRVLNPMRIGFLLCLLITTTLLNPNAFRGQRLPPPEPPRPLPETGNESPTFRVTTNEVLVPTLVEKGDGSIAYGLKASDFALEDNGVPQKIRVQEDLDAAPVALVVAVEEGGASALEFDKVAKLAPLLDLFLSDPQSQAALIGFDSKPHLLHDYTHSSEDLEETLKNLQPGDGGAAILDTISSAIDLLNDEPKSYRRVLLLISEERDHGSRHTKPVLLIQKIGRSDVLVLSVSFSASRAQLLNDLSGHNQGGSSADLLAPLKMAINAFKKNLAKEIARESGGEYATFTRDKAFEQRVADAAKHVRNRYLITFSPSNRSPGLHTIHVKTTQDYGTRIVARANYWMAQQ